MIERLLLMVVLAILSHTASGAEAYRWEDAAGNVHYSDELPPTGARNIQRTRIKGNTSTESLPYQLQVAVSRFPVTLYVATDCGEPCDLARDLLIQRGVPHTLLDASGYEVQQMLMALSKGELEVPVVKIGKRVLTGFEAGKWNLELDIAGYPATALIKVTPQTPQSAEQPAAEESGNGGVAATDDAEADAGEPEDLNSGDIDSGEPEDVEQSQ